MDEKEERKELLEFAFLTRGKRFVTTDGGKTWELQVEIARSDWVGVLDLDWEMVRKLLVGMEAAIKEVFRDKEGKIHNVRDIFAHNITEEELDEIIKILRGGEKYGKVVRS